MSRSTFQKAPTKILVDSLSSTSITYPGSNDVVINVGGQIIKFNLDSDTIECTDEACYAEGTKGTASIVLTDLFTDTCDCVQCLGISVVQLGQTNFKIANAFAKVRPYKACAPKGTAVVIDDIGAQLEAQINADRFAIVVATYTSGTDTLELEAKDFGVHTFATASTAGTWTITAGTNPVLTSDDMFKLFPPAPLNVGTRGPKMAGDVTTYCQYYIKTRIANNFDPIEGGGEDTINEYYFYVNSALATYDDNWKDKWDACNFNAS